METKRLFIAAVLVWVIGSVAIYYLYSRGHLQEVSNVSVPSLRLAPLRGLVSTTPTATDVARSLEADVVSRPGEANPAVTPVELPVSSSSVPTTAAPTTAAPTTAAPTPGRTKHGSEEQELRLGLAEKVDLPQDGSDIYISVLTTPGYHDSRLSRQYITWMQTVHPKQIHVVTEGGEDIWTEALTLSGYRVVYCDCPRDHTKTQRMMCCKGGTQFDHWYQAREAGEVYNWYCHFDDDIYVNTAALIQLTQRFDHTKDQYLGKWKRLSERVYGNSDRISGWTAPGLFNFQERKRNDYRYANGPAYCISASLMMRLEKYLRAQNFVHSCNKAQAVMDDVLPGVIIEGVLGVEVTDIPEITDQLDYPPYDDKSWYLRQITVASEMIQLPSGKYHGRDEVLSYHCLLYPGVSWCK